MLQLAIGTFGIVKGFPPLTLIAFPLWVAKDAHRYSSRQYFMTLVALPVGLFLATFAISYRLGHNFVADITAPNQWFACTTDTTFSHLKAISLLVACTAFY